MTGVRSWWAPPPQLAAHGRRPFRSLREHVTEDHGGVMMDRASDAAVIAVHDRWHGVTAAHLRDLPHAAHGPDGSAGRRH